MLQKCQDGYQKACTSPADSKNHVWNNILFKGWELKAFG